MGCIIRKIRINERINTWRIRGTCRRKKSYWLKISIRIRIIVKSIKIIWGKFKEKKRRRFKKIIKRQIGNRSQNGSDQTKRIRSKIINYDRRRKVEIIGWIRKIKIRIRKIKSFIRKRVIRSRIKKIIRTWKKEIRITKIIRRSIKEKRKRRWTYTWRNSKKKKRRS